MHDVELCVPVNGSLLCNPRWGRDIIRQLRCKITQRTQGSESKSNYFPSRLESGLDFIRLVGSTASCPLSSLDSGYIEAGLPGLLRLESKRLILRIAQLAAVAAVLRCLGSQSNYDVYYNVAVSHEPVRLRDSLSLWCAALRHLSVLLLALGELSGALLG